MKKRKKSYLREKQSTKTKRIKRIAMKNRAMSRRKSKRRRKKNRKKNKKKKRKRKILMNISVNSNRRLDLAHFNHVI